MQQKTIIQLRDAILSIVSSLNMIEGGKYSAKVETEEASDICVQAEDIQKLINADSSINWGAGL